MALIGGAYWLWVNVINKEIKTLASVANDDVYVYKEVKCSPEHAEKPQGNI